VQYLETEKEETPDSKEKEEDFMIGEADLEEEEEQDLEEEEEEAQDYKEEEEDLTEAEKEEAVDESLAAGGNEHS
jgi:hypothetical protein